MKISNFLTGKRALMLISLLIAISMIITITLYEPLGCDKIESLNAFVQVARMDRSSIGFDLDRQNLTFGKISPGAVAERVVYLKYSEEAEVKVWMKGDLEPWTTIEPNELKVLPEVQESIKFTVTVPESAATGDYSGKAFFCYDISLSNRLKKLI